MGAAGSLVDMKCVYQSKETCGWLWQTILLWGKTDTKWWQMNLEHGGCLRRTWKIKLGLHVSYWDKGARKPWGQERMLSGDEIDPRATQMGCGTGPPFLLCLYLQQFHLAHPSYRCRFSPFSRERKQSIPLLAEHIAIGRRKDRQVKEGFRKAECWGQVVGGKRNQVGFQYRSLNKWRVFQN